MSIVLTQEFRIAGSVVSAGTVLNWSDSVEADFLHRNLAVPYYGPTPGYKALAIGDSITAQAEVILAATSVTNNGNGTARVVRTNHGSDVGDPIRITGANDPVLNVLDSYVTARIDANTIDIALVGRRHGVTSGSTPSVTFPLQRAFRGWLMWLEMLRGEMFDSTWCCVGGATTAQLQPLVDNVETQHDIAFVAVGMNDIYSEGVGLDVLKRRFVEMFSAAAARAVHVVVLTIPPRNSADGSWTAGRQTIHTQFNRWLMTYVPNRGGHAVDTWRATANGATYVNAGATNPDPLAAMAFDNTHPNARGAQAFANAVKPVVDALLPGRVWAPAHSAQVGADVSNIFTDSTFATDTAGVATGWVVSDSTASMVVTPSMVSRTVADHGDAVGRIQRLAVSYGSASGTANTRFRRNNFQASVAAGKRMQMRIPFSVTDAVGLVGLDLSITGTTAAGLFVTAGPVQNSNVGLLTGNFSGVLMTPIVTVPPGITDLDCWVRPYITSAQSSAVTIDLWHPELRVFD